MSAPTSDDATSASERASLKRLFVLILLTEVVTLTGLYWFGVHFS